MKRLFRRRPDLSLDRMFETRSDAWAAVGLEFEVNRREVQRSRRRLGVLVVALAAVIWGDGKMNHHFTLMAQEHHYAVKGVPKAWASIHVHTWYLPHGVFTAIAVIAVLVLGWMISRDLSRIAPALFTRLDPSTAGPVEFLVRLVAVAATALGALAVAGISFHALLVGGAFTAVVVGLAAQQTLGNLFAGMVLLSARPFRLGERIRLQAGAVAGSAEGIVSQQGLLYTTLARGDDRIMIPNNVVLAAAVVPLKEPDSVDVKVRLGAGVRPTHVQAILDSEVATPTRNPPSVLLEEIDGDEVVVRVQATPERREEGAKLADEIIAALASVTGEHDEVRMVGDQPGGTARDAPQPGAPGRPQDARSRT
ncbi:MAG TPA: mechanosensitive ion channel family protein [Solirubrobacteraceae bacterium]|nr:mechanosensitive ion channel family protein [Solirubrobacteraceae bacterium]